MIDIGHLSAPFHVRMSGFLLALALPGSPDRGFLLSDTNQHDSVLAFASGDLQKRIPTSTLLIRQRTIAGYEAIHMIRKGQAYGSAAGAKVALLPATMGIGSPKSVKWRRKPLSKLTLV